MAPRRSRTTARSARRAARAALVVVVALVLSGCGTRVDDAELEAAVGGGTVTLSPESIRALTQPRDGVESPGTAPGAPATTSQAGADIAGGQRGATAEATKAKPGIDGRPTAAGPERDSTSDSTASVAPAAPRRTGGCRATLAPVAVGQVGTFSGLLGPITGSMRTTLAAWARDLNSRGGLACHPITVYSADDGADPARAASLAQDMADRKHVVAFVGNALVFPAGFQQAIAKAKVPAVGGPGPNSWRDSPWVFPEGASFADQIYGLVRNGVEQGKRRLGLVICVEATACGEFAKDFQVAAPAAGAEFIYSNRRR